MAIPVIMPKQGQSVETCIITGWLKKKGEVVHTGDILFSYETDKAAFDYESSAEGVLLDIFYEEGAEVPVLENVAVLGAPGEETESYRPGKGGAKTAHAVEKSTDVSAVTAAGKVTIPVADTNVKTRISPRAKRFADGKRVNYSNIQGSGPNGRIIVRDVEAFLSGKSPDARLAGRSFSEGPTPDARRLTPDAGFTESPLSNVRKMIARAMHFSLQNSAQLTHHMSADVRNLMEARKKIKSELAEGRAGQDITLNDMICWCVIRALKKFPEANSHFLDDRIRTFNNVHLGIAVDTPRGLMVPVIRNADTMDIIDLSKALKLVAEACRKGNVSPELLQSTAASFTVSNLGAYGVEMFTPVINLPQAAILGVCTIIHRPADLGNGVFGFIPVIGLSLTYDHRAIDGGPATLFLKEIKEEIEKFRI
jgi:pyruvate dehydrogenase E2 component (dihydrolipoamide acetyltransferase)